jgi:signal transduction histidine kinase
MNSLSLPSYPWRWFTAPLLFGVLFLSSLIFIYLRGLTDSLLLYLPTTVGIILVHWYGPKVLPLAYLNSFITLQLQHVKGSLLRVVLLATNEPAILFTSWILINLYFTNSLRLNNTRSLVRFTLLGIVLPDLVNCFYTYHYSFVNGDLRQVFLLWLDDFVTMFAVIVPVMHFFKPVQGAKSVRVVAATFLKKNKLTELLLAGFLFLSFNFLVDFDQYWFLYGICATIIAVRSGFEIVILINAFIFSLSYVLPIIGLVKPTAQLANQSLSVHLGMATMFFVSALIGRVISDLRKIQKELTVQKKQLESANDQLHKKNIELDRFVYSVSHDISAPLKSIKGLVVLSRMDRQWEYLDKIELSVQKLEGFVGELLDHSRTGRKEFNPQPIHLREFFDEIMDNLKYQDNFSRIQFTYSFNAEIVNTDKFLLKVALSNILSNAVKYQKRYRDHHPEINISSVVKGNHVNIVIQDNGEGIASEYKDKIFEMFYRGTTHSSGSGLGLYIAHEAVEKLKGEITVDTVFGEGSTFTVSLPLTA